MRLDHLDADGTVVRFPAERRQAPDICLAAELAATDELWGGLLDHGLDADWPDWKAEGANELAELLAAHEVGGIDAAAVLVAAREHVAALVAAAVALGWAYRDAGHAAEQAGAALERALARPGGDWLGHHAAEVERTRAALYAAAAASCEAYLLASGAHEAVGNLALGRGARLSTRDELEADCFALWQLLPRAARATTG
jgi:uncharacterized protein YukE